MTETAPSPATEPPYLAGLNPPQREAVLTTEGPVLVLAGAGTGKTAALTARLAHLLHTRKAWPSEILAVTFTNKAAREMKERVARLTGGGAEGMPWLGTFHATGAKMLRRHAELVGLKSNFTILDTDDQLRLMKQLITAAGIDEKRWPARMLGGLIDRWKNKGWTPDQVDVGEAEAFAAGQGARLYRLYQERLRQLNACDFGDLLLHMLVILKGHRDVLELYQQRFRYILVDEYQDTNQAQYLWLRLLAQERRNLCCVGDDDQSIYSWRGAEVTNILRFETDFPGAKIIRLEQNYRSTPHILAAASGLIAQNAGRLGKTLWTEHGEGDKLRVIGVWDGPEEARRVGEELEVRSSAAEPASTAAPSWSAPSSRRASSRTGSSPWACPTGSSGVFASTSAPRSGTRSLICASSTSPTTTSPSSASSTRPSAASATKRWRGSTRWPAPATCRWRRRRL